MNTKLEKGTKVYNTLWMVKENADFKTIEEAAAATEKASDKKPDRMVLPSGLYKHLFGKFPVKITNFNGMKIEVRK